MIDMLQYALENDMREDLDSSTQRTKETARWKQGYKTGHHVQGMKTLAAIDRLVNAHGYVSADDLREAIKAEWKS